MACDWNLHYASEPDPETETIECQCRTCGRVKALSCHREFSSGRLVINVETCARKRPQQTL